MKKGLMICGGVVLLLVLAAGWWKQEFPSASWRYKITIEIETPEGIKSGAAVREISASASPGFLGVEAKVFHAVKGEAVPIDMGQEKYLFALMDTEGSPKIISAAFPYMAKDDADYVRHYSRLKTDKTVLPVSLYPMFVIFKDINDPKSVELVYGGRFDPKLQRMVPVNDFETVLGKGVKIKDITIEMTDEPVTREIESVLGWLPNVKKGSLDGSLTNYSTELSNILHHGYFKRGE